MRDREDAGPGLTTPQGQCPLDAQVPLVPQGEPGSAVALPGHPVPEPASAGRGMPDAVLSFVLTLLVGLVSAVVVSRLYGVRVIGEFALVAAPYGMVGQFSNVGEQVAVVRALASERASSRRAVSLFLVVLGFSVLLTTVTALVVGVVSYLLLAGPVDRPDLVGPAFVLVGAYLLFANGSWNCDTLLAVFRHTRSLLVCRVFDVTLLLLVTVALALVGPRDIDALVQATVVALAAGLVLRVVLVRRVLTARPDRESLRQAVHELPALLRFGVRVVPGGAAHALTLHAATWIIGAVRSVDVLGAFSRANNLASRLIDAGYRLAEVVLPVLSRHCAVGEHQRAADVFARWRRLTALGLVAACAPVSGAAQGLLDVFGRGFDAAWAAMGLLLLAYGTGVLANLQGQFLLALGRPGLSSKLVIVRAVVALTLIGPLTAWAGTTGAAGATAAGYVVGLVLSVLATDRSARDNGADLPALPWLRLVTVSAVAFVVARALDLALPGVLGALTAAGAGVAAAAVAGLALRLVGTQEVRDLLGRARSSPRSPLAAPQPSSRRRR